MSQADIPRLADYIDHILQAINNIHEYVVGMDESAFANDRRTQDAVIRNFEIIGEASRIAVVVDERHLHMSVCDGTSLRWAIIVVLISCGPDLGIRLFSYPVTRREVQSHLSVTRQSMI